MSVFKNSTYQKYLVIALVTIISVVLAACTLPPQFTYQGVLTDASGNPLNGNVTITYRIFNAETGGTEIYSESETVTVTDGRFDSVIGPEAAISGLDPEDLAQALWVEVQIDNGTYNETLTPRQRLYGSPYAFTLMPGTVISAAMNEEVFGVNDIDAIASVINMQIPNSSNTPLPALRVVGERGIELVDVSGSDSYGTLYSEIDVPDSSIHAHVNTNFVIHLDEAGSDYDSGFVVFGNSTSNWCYFDEYGNLDCSGTKSSVTEVDGEQRALYAIESPDVWFEDFGSAQLTNGKTTVQVDAQFAQTVNLDMEYHVFLTPLGDCNGLYVTNKTAGGFEVRELGGGSSDVAFDYRIVAKRAGYEDVHLEVVPSAMDEGGE